MEKSEIIKKINELKSLAGITHDKLAEIIYEARDKRLREIREEYQDKSLMFYFKDGLLTIEVKNDTIPNMVENFPSTLKEMIKDYQRKNGELGMMINENIPAGWADFQMS